MKIEKSGAKGTKTFANSPITSLSVFDHFVALLFSDWIRYKRSYLIFTRPYLCQ